MYSEYSVYCVVLSPAPPLTFDNLYKAVKGVKSWRDLGDRLGLLPYELDTIQREHGPDDLCLKVVVEKFLQGECRLYPHPSWQTVIWTLDEINETHLADETIDYGEPVQGECTLYMVMYVGWRWV